MANKVFLKDNDGNAIMPITRAELVVDSQGQQALHSAKFVASTEMPGLLSAEDKEKIDNIATTYSLSGGLSSNNTYTTTLTASEHTTSAIIPAMVEASSSNNGKAGLVPAPAKGDQNKVLSGGGSWITGSDIINSLSEGTTNATRDDYIIAQYAKGGTTTKTYHRRKLSNIFAALNTSDITTALGYTPYNSTNPNKYITSSGSITGNAATATTATNLASAPSLATSGTTQITVTAGGKTSSAFTVPYATSAGSATTATNANNVYINTSDTNSSYPVPFVTSTGTGNKALYIDSQTGTYGIRYNPNTNALYSSGGFYESSDNKLKNYKKDIEVDLKKLSKLPKKYFTWKSDTNDTLNIGTSAQEVQKLYPELVTDSGDFLAVDYAKLSVIALAAIDKLYEENQKLKERLTILETKLN